MNISFEASIAEWVAAGIPLHVIVAIVGEEDGIKFDDCDFVELELDVEIGHYSPGRPAPYCCNPSSPAYSDPGDPPECEYVARLRAGDVDEIDTNAVTGLDDEIWERVEAECERASRDRY